MTIPSHLMKVGSMGLNTHKKETYAEVIAARQQNKMQNIEEFNKKLDDQIKIMCALLKSQLPGQESDPQKMMEPVFQIMNTEQMVHMNYNMGQLHHLQKEKVKSDMVQFLDQDVLIKTDRFTFEGDEINFSYELPEYLNNPRCEIYSVHNMSVPIQAIDLDPNEKMGELRWTGHLPSGEMVKEGGYVVRIVGESQTKKDLESKPILVEGETSAFIHVDSIHVDKEKNKTYLTSGHMIFSPDDIQSIKKKPDLSKFYKNNHQEVQDNLQVVAESNAADQINQIV